ncbi:Proline-rich spliceosome-associated [Hirschfeldia incana]|nr:Proline-rich spliceosome-associated [Hirschfeldia incana]
MAASSFSGLEGQKDEHNSDMEEDMDLTEDDFRNVSGQFSREASTATVTDAVNASVETVKVDVSSKTGVKRARTISTEHQPSVHVTYKHLTRASKQKLESLLQQWSEWEAEQTTLLCQSDQDQEPALESGEDTYFPALRVGLQNASSVSFWFDCKTGQDSLKEFVPVESSTTPLYNRKFTIGLDSTVGSSNVEGGLEIIDDDPPRCFNCGAYSHSLRECPKPVDRSAVSIARRQHKSKRNQASGSRLPSRYYKSAQAGKYDGLKPGSLDPETRQLLGLGELDPPPWLHRMREIGYPPGYLAVEEDHLSGITIFDEEETEPPEEGEVKAEDGEILEVASTSEPEMKMTVEFPGINAPIPENADVWLWQQRKNTGYGYSHDHQYRGVMGPPGLELSSSYPPRYGGGIRYDHRFGSRPQSPVSELGRRYYYSPYNQDLR